MLKYIYLKIGDDRMFQVGDYVVKATNGVCKVVDILSPDFVDDDSKLYYQLMPLSNENSKLYVPIDNENDTMREVMTEEEAENLIRKIPRIEAAWIVNEKEREHSYKETIQSNDPEKIVGIIKNIYKRKKDRQEHGKKSTAVDGKYFGIAENLLYTELEIVMNRNRDAIYSMIKESCEEDL